MQNWAATRSWYSGTGTRVLFLSTPTKLKTEAEGTRGPNGDGERGENMQLPRVPQDKVVFWCKMPRTIFFFYLQKNNAIIINPNEDTQLAATFSKLFGGAVFTSRQPGLNPGKQPPEFLNCHPFSLKETRGLWSMINNMLKVKQENGTK